MPMAPFGYKLELHVLSSKETQKAMKVLASDQLLRLEFFEKHSLNRALRRL
jgi:hypothetical protein